MKKLMSLLAALGGALIAEATIPAPTYILPFDTAYNQMTAQTMPWYTSFSVQGTHFDLVSSPLGKAMQGWGEGPYVPESGARFDYGWSWTANLRVKTVNKADSIILSMGRCSMTANPGLVITTDGANGIKLKIVKEKTTVMDSCSVPVENATASYHDYTLLFSYTKSTQAGEINAYADGVWKGKVAWTIAPYFTGSQGLQLFGQYGGQGSGICTYGSKTDPQSSIEDFRFWRDTVFTEEQVVELHEQYKLATTFTGTPDYHWTFDTALNDQSGATKTLNFSSGMSYTLKNGAIEGKGEGPYWINAFDFSGSWTWLMRLKTIDAEKSCICSLGWCTQGTPGVMVVTDGTNGVRVLSIQSKSTCVNSLTVNVPNATTEFHDYALTYLEGTAAVAVFVDGVYQGELPITTGQFNAKATVQLFGECGGQGTYCTYDTPGSQIDDLKLYRYTKGRAITWNGTDYAPYFRLSAGNLYWQDANTNDTFYSDRCAVTFTDAAARTAVTLFHPVTVTTVTIDNSTKDYTFDSANTLYVLGSFTKLGSGRVVWSTPIGWGNTYEVNNESINLESGVFQLNTTTANILGASGNVVVSDGAQFDLHTTGAANAASPVLAKTFHLAGTGPDGSGALVNTGNNTAGQHLGSVVLDADATIGGTSRIDLRTADKGITGAEKTLMVKNTAGLTVAGGTLDVGALVVADGAMVTYESGTFATDMISGPGTIALANGMNLTLAVGATRPALTVSGGASTVSIAAPDAQTAMLAALDVAASSGCTFAINGADLALGDSFPLTATSVTAETCGRTTVVITDNAALDATVSRNDDGQLIVTLVAKHTATDLVWSALGGNWDRGVTANWLAGAEAVAFWNGDSVTFDDTGVGEVTLAANVSPARVTFKNETKDYSVTGAYSLAADALVKDGAGTLTWGETRVAATTPVTISNGVLRLNSSTADLFGSSGTITVEKGGQLDFNNQQEHGGSSPLLNRTLKVAGAGPDGSGAFVNNGNLNWGYSFSSMELMDDTTIGGTGRTDVRVANQGIVGVDKTLTVKCGGLVVAGGKIQVGTIRVPDGGLLQYASGTIQADEIVLTNGIYESWNSSCTTLPNVPLRVQGTNNVLRPVLGTSRHYETITVEPDAVLKMEIPETQSIKGPDTMALVDNAGTIHQESGFWGIYGLINREGATIIHDSLDTGGVRAYAAITNNGLIWVKRSATTGTQFINYTDKPIYGTGDLKISSGVFRLNGNNLQTFTGRMIYGGGDLRLSAVTDATTVLALAPWQFVVEAGATYTLPLTVAAGVDLTTLAPIVGRKIDAQGTFQLNVTLSEQRKDGRWKLTNTGDYTKEDIANWRVSFLGVEDQQGALDVLNGNVYLRFGPGGLVIFLY